MAAVLIGSSVISVTPAAKAEESVCINIDLNQLQQTRENPNLAETKKDSEKIVNELAQKFKDNPELYKKYLEFLKNYERCLRMNPQNLKEEQLKRMLAERTKKIYDAF